VHFLMETDVADAFSILSFGTMILAMFVHGLAIFSTALQPCVWISNVFWGWVVLLQRWRINIREAKYTFIN